MSRVPIEHFDIPLFARKSVKYSERPDCEVFMVKSTTQPHMKVRCWCTTGGRASLQELYNNLPEFENDERRGGFVNGRPLTHLSVTISTCAGQSRPKTLYRVVHDEQPHYGRKARGHGIVKVTPLSFQILVEKHLNWRCRQPSPFMSSTNDQRKVRRIVQTLQEHGFTGIQVIEFRTSGDGWNHTAQRLFYAPTLRHNLNRTNYRNLPYLENDYLLESHIPPESILSVEDIEDVHWEPAPKRSKKREAPDNSEEERKSSKRSKNFMRERRA
ncbi:hypothetical protein F5X97DRAFT_320888 [Nemania serpens]|nr:hypothetical protein F5X97DRAFT_320888 [Nemania serpens]